MDSPFLDAMRRAAQATRDGNTADATRVIREALSGAAPPADDFDGVTIEGTLAGDAGDASEARAGSPPPGTLPMLSQTYAGPAGARDYRLFVPPPAPGGPRGLVVMLHGCTQDPDDFARGTAMNAIAAREGLVVAYPAQAAAHNPNGCWNWFDPANQGRGRGEPAILAGLAQDVARIHDVPEGAVFAAGLSAGGAMAAILGEAYADVFAAVGVHSGLPPGSAHDIPSAFAAMKGRGAEAPSARPGALRARLMVIHGRKDRTVVPANGARLFDARARALPEAELRREPSPGRGVLRQRLVLPEGTVAAEHWDVAGLGHAWSGGDGAGSYTAPLKAGASDAFVRFFLDTKA